MPGVDFFLQQQQTVIVMIEIHKAAPIKHPTTIPAMAPPSSQRSLDVQLLEKARVFFWK